MISACENSLLFSSLPMGAAFFPGVSVLLQLARCAGLCHFSAVCACPCMYTPGFSWRGAALQICIRSMALALQLCRKCECSNSPSD